jgi:16S rRNA (uracil1498-N3)-methyltransferase
MLPAATYNPCVAARFYLPGFEGDASEATLPAEESHHLAHVMRLAPGAEVRVFNGCGGEWVATVRGIARAGATLRIGAPVRAAPECAVSIVLGQALLKGDHVDAVIRDATMLGAAAVWPLRTAHTAVPGRADGARAAARWQRVAVASAKQCGRAVVPVIRPVSPAEVAFDAEPDAVRLLLVEPAARVAAVSRVEPLAEQAKRHGAFVLVGPEGGWNADEVARATAAGFVPWRLGTVTLRADAVAVVAIAVLRYGWDV